MSENTGWKEKARESWEKGKSRGSGGGIPPGGPSRVVAPDVLKCPSRPRGEMCRECPSLTRMSLGSGGSVPEMGCQTQARTGGDARVDSMLYTKENTSRN